MAQRLHEELAAEVPKSQPDIYQPNKASNHWRRVQHTSKLSAKETERTTKYAKDYESVLGSHIRHNRLNHEAQPTTSCANASLLSDWNTRLQHRRPDVPTNAPLTS